MHVVLTANASEANWLGLTWLIVIMVGLSVYDQVIWKKNVWKECLRVNGMSKGPNS